MKSKSTTLKIAGAAVLATLLSVGRMSGQTAGSTAGAQTAAQVLSNIIANESTAPLNMYPPGFVEYLQSLGDSPYPPTPAATSTASARTMGRMSMMSQMSPMDNSQEQVPPIYGVVDLGDLGSGTSYANGINANGTVVGYSYDYMNNQYAFEYTNQLSFEYSYNLGNIGLAANGIVFSQANAINNSGQIVGCGFVPSDSLTHALSYFNGSAVDLAPGFGFHCTATSINNHGQEVGYCRPQIVQDIGISPDGTSSQGNDAFLNSGGVVQDLGTISGFVGSAANGINDVGQIVGSSWPNGGSSHAFVCTSSTPMTDLDSALGGNGYSVACGINNIGQIVGVAYNAFIYSTADGQFTDLGALDDPINNASVGYGINNNGVAVGTVYISSIADNHAFVYSGGLMQDLNTLIDPASGWELQYATGINDAGQITGYGISPSGQTHAFLLDPYFNLNYTGYHQGSTGSEVPNEFGNIGAVNYGGPVADFDPANGRAYTVYYGCALCSAAAMLSSLSGLDSMTPDQLNTYLINYPHGFDNGDSLKFLNVGPAVGYPIGYTGYVSVTSRAEVDRYLEDYCWGNRYRVILELAVNGDPNNTHYVLVVGRTANDWILFDPGWSEAYVGGARDDGALLSLNAHYTGFGTYGRSGKFNSWQFKVEGIIPFKLGASSAYTECTVHSPVEVLVTDPNGNRVGYDPSTGTNVFEIPGASYEKDYAIVDADEDDIPSGETNGIKMVYIPSPVGGTYTTLLTGTDAGSYTFDQSIFWPGNAETNQTTTGTIDIGVISTNTLFVIVPPVITASSVSAGTFNLTFTTQTNVPYAVLGDNSLVNTNWTLLTTVTATSTNMTVSVPTSDPNMMFYRVVSQ